MQPVKFGKYMLVDMIASGGMAEIYKGFAKSADRKMYSIAIKRILPQFARDEEFVALLLDEAKVMVYMNHPNIVSIIEFGKVDETYYIAMEYVEGPTLQKLFKKVRAKNELLPVPIALFIVREIAQGLGYAHRKLDNDGNAMSIVHRDISPANILISYTGDVKITDFGISKAANQNHHTQVGIIRGKTGYMSPEQTRAGMEIDGRSDLFSLGVIMYELLTGRRLFKADSVPKALKMVREGHIPPISELRPGLPASLENIVYRALQRDPNERYQSGEEFCDALNEFLTKYSAAKNFMRVTHNDLQKYVHNYFAHSIEETRAFMQQYENIEETISRQMTASKNIEKTLTEPKVLVANPNFDGEALSSGAMNVDQLESSVITGASSSSIHSGTYTKAKELGYSSTYLWIKKLMLPVMIFVFTGIIVAGFMMKKNKNKNISSVEMPVFSSPEGAEIYIDNIRWPDKTPTKITLLEKKEVTILFKKQGYKNLIKVLNPTEDTQSLNVTLEEGSSVGTRGTVIVSTDPKGATVYLDGEKIEGTTPLEVKVAIGKDSKITIEKDGYKTAQTYVNMAELEVIEKSIILSRDDSNQYRVTPPKVNPLPKLGGKAPVRQAVARINLSVATTPWAEVYLDDKKVGVSPFVGLKVKPGRHKIRFENKQFDIKPMTVTVTFPKGTDIKCIYDLKERTGSCE
ncbi:MAG TPA: serine/threonine-protein kinase [Oligoflexia bacterium]|nr:serine/threonine-protein kinase [Oligoflexia bacterium]HMR24705.1 serine/threonine-protein kinase [Oligoflexia bacterium]